MLTQLFERPSRDGRCGLQLFGRSKTETNFFRKRVEVGKQKPRELHEFGRRFFREFFFLVEGVVSIEANSMGPRLHILGDLAFRREFVDSLLKLPRFDFGAVGFQCNFEASAEHRSSRRVVATIKAARTLVIGASGRWGHIFRDGGFCRGGERTGNFEARRNCQVRLDVHRIVGVRGAINLTGEWTAASGASAERIPYLRIYDVRLGVYNAECGARSAAVGAVGDDRSHALISLVVGLAGTQRVHLSATVAGRRQMAEVA